MSAPSHVYVISTFGGFFSKIGVSDSPRKRLAQLQTACPHELTLCYSLAFRDRSEARVIEHAAHELLADRREAGEWFDIPPDMGMDAIMQVAGIE